MNEENYGFALKALHMVGCGEPPDEIAERLVIAVAGEDIWRQAADKQMTRLARKLKWHSANLVKAVEATLDAVGDAIEVPAKLLPAQNDELAEILAGPDPALIDRLVSLNPDEDENETDPISASVDTNDGIHAA